MIRLPEKDRVHVQVRVPYKDEKEVVVFYGPTDERLVDALPIEITYDISMFPGAEKLRDGMETVITLPPPTPGKLQL